MSDIIQCSKCGAAITVTEALARPFIEAERLRIEQELRERRSVLEADYQSRVNATQRDAESNRAKVLELQTVELDYRKERAALADERQEFELKVARQMDEERSNIRLAATRDAEKGYHLALAERDKSLAELSAKVVEFQRMEIEIRNEREKLEDEKRASDVELSRRMEEDRARVRAEALQEAENKSRLLLAEKEKSLAEVNAKLAESQKNEIEVRMQRQTIEDEKRVLDLELARRVDSERVKIREEVAMEAEQKYKLVLADREKSLSDLKASLAESQNAELEIRRQREELEREKNTLELTVTRQIDVERKQIRELAIKEESERNHFRFAEKDKVIDDLRKQGEEIQRKSQQGSQQLQGEVLERALETELRAAFPVDVIEPVPTGYSGGDIVHQVVGPNGLVCGTILWESKRTKDWNDQWLDKNKNDQRSIQANVGVIVSAALPKNVTRFDRRQEVWVSAFDCAVPLAMALREMLTSIALAQVSEQGRKKKSDRAYDYVNSQAFKHRVTAMAQAHGSLLTAVSIT